MIIRTRTRFNRGFSLLEVLITLLVLSIGLLGVAAMQAFSLKANQSANFRTQATALANMMAERMRAHGGGALNTTVAYYGSGSDARASADLADWQNAIQAQLPNGVGTLVFNGDNIGVSITWTDARWAIGDANQQTAFVLTTTL
jgi:type IV pilus assembly protein PilV